jgi:hypothetical protein
LNTDIVYVIVYDIVHYISYLILCIYTGAIFHYNKDSTTYGVARNAVPSFQDDANNPLINELGIYILDKLCMFQNMQDYAVTADTDIDHYVRKCTILVDGTKIYRFSTELLAYFEMCVAFSPYYSQDDPRTAGAIMMDTYFRDALETYADVPYKDLHDYLARRFHAWYAKFKPSSSAVVSVGDPELGAVVPVEGVDGAAPPAKKPRFSLTLKNVSASPVPPRPLLPAVHRRDHLHLGAPGRRVLPLRLRRVLRRRKKVARKLLPKSAADKAVPTRRQGCHRTFDAQ